MLICFRLTGNFLIENDISLLSLNVTGKDEELVSTRSGALLAGDIVKGRFHSQYKNIGLLSVRFDNNYHTSDDVLMFRFKESGAEKWFYEAKYNTDQFQPHKLFPFGFPLIADSVGKDYIFELESLKGTTESGILIDRQDPVFVAKSSFSKAYLLQNKKELQNFIVTKPYSLLVDPIIRFNLLIYFSPLILYLVFLLFRQQSYQLLSLFTVSIALWESFYVKGSYDILYLSVFVFWLMISGFYKLEGRISALYAISFLILTPIMLVIGNDKVAEKIAVWAYLFLCLTVGLQIWELKRKSNKLITLEKFISNFHDIKLNNTHISKFIKPTVIILICILLLNIKNNLLSPLKLYQVYYENNYVRQFIFGTAIYLIPLYAVAILIFGYLKKVGIKMYLKTFLVVLFLSIVQPRIISATTEYMHKAHIFHVNPSIVGELWTDVSISGINFADLPFIGMVTINGVEQRVIQWKNDRIIFRTNPQTTKSGNIVITTMDGKQSNSVPFTYNIK